MKRQKISTARRHLYFYVLLFLTTAVAHNVWLSIRDSETNAVAEAQLRELKGLASSAQEMARHTP